MIVEDKEFDDEETEGPMRGGGSFAVDPELYSMLKDLRKKLSKHLQLPPYVIFQDPSLEAMATTYPVTIDELQNIPGVGSRILAMDFFRLEAGTSTVLCFALLALRMRVSISATGSVICM